MITFFTAPKPFKGHIDTIQRNAIESWLRLRPCEVILFGDEDGVTGFLVRQVNEYLGWYKEILREWGK